jgi:hypothetical protein
MNENFKYGAAAVAVVGLSIGAVVYLSWREKAPPPPVEEPVAAVPAPAPAAPLPEEPAIKHPLPPPETKEPLPSLDESDPPLQNALTDLIGRESVQQFVVPKDLVRHIVVTVDNLSEKKVAERLRPVRPAPGRFAITGPEEAPVLDPANYQRYKPMVQLILATDTQRLVDTYSRYYPLFQDAYENLGHPPEYFNDRLIEVIDHLLATPELQGPIALAQPNVLYEFADPELEARSAGQKALIRMGSDNAKAVKDKLRELRSALAAQQLGD